jgi:hypothetical protein
MLSSTAVPRMANSLDISDNPRKENFVRLCFRTFRKLLDQGRADAVRGSPFRLDSDD